MSGSPKSFVWAFVVGGAAGVVVQLLLMLLPMLGVPAGLVILFALGIIAAIGFILDITGLYQKLVRLSGMGAILPFFALPTAVSTSTCGALKQKKSIGAVIWDGVKGTITIFGIGAIVCIIGVIVVRALDSVGTR